jgi:hypothetical protein
MELLEKGRDNITELYELSDLGKKSPKADDLTVYCLVGVFQK